MQTLAMTRVSLGSLVPDPSNARLHGPENLEAIAASLKRFGQTEPLIVQKATRLIIGGNGRHRAMQQLGWTECNIVEVDCDNLEATSLAIALNRTAELATWDNETLSKLLSTLRAEDALEGVGFDSSQIDDLLAELKANEPRQVDDPGPGEPPEVPVSRRGDLWLLGDHRLLCGDSTNAADVKRVMGGTLANLVATDSPYLVDYTGERPNNSGKDWTAVYKEVEIKDADQFFRATCTNILEALAPHGAIYFWHAHKRCGLIQQISTELGILDHQQIIWVKPSPVFGRVFWHFRHEPCMMGWRKGSQPDHDGDQSIDSVWEVDWNGKARIQSDHPTSKPTELFQRPIRKHTKAGDICLEPFSGSGSQIIAAEIENRRCYAIEISEPFVDVAIERWQVATGRAAVLEATNQTYSQIAAERKSP